MRPTTLFTVIYLLCFSSAMGEAMLQYFNTNWREISNKMPELAEAGYESIWVPPPTKASGGLSVGYDLWDRFDLGGKDSVARLAPAMVQSRTCLRWCVLPTVSVFEYILTT